MEETAHLAPHGVPSNPMARSLSKSNLGPRPTTNNNDRGYGTNNPSSTTTGGFLGVPVGGEGNSFYGQEYDANQLYCQLQLKKIYLMLDVVVSTKVFLLFWNSVCRKSPLNRDRFTNYP